MELTEHLFRHEWGRMVGAVTRIFGVHNLPLAEDVVQEAFCRATEVWSFRGVPENPSAWLWPSRRTARWMSCAWNGQHELFALELGRLLESEWAMAPVVDELFMPNAIKDDQLRMIFSCCHPRLSEKSQVALILHILCGFSVDEIASAFVSRQAAIEKRITRAKKVLAGSKRLYDVAAPADFSARLPSVRQALYFLFNEGYHGASPEASIRSELCREAMRLAALLLDQRLGAVPATYAYQPLCV